MAPVQHEIAASLQPLSRRRLLKTCVAAGAGALAFGSLGCSEPAQQNATHLNPDTAAVFTGLSRVMFPPNEQLFSVDNVAITEPVSHLLGLLDPAVRKDLTTAVSLFDYGAIVLGWHFSRFSRLDQEAASRYVHRWQNGNQLQRGIITTLKKLVYTAYWKDPRTWEAVGFDGPVSDKWGLEKLGNAPVPSEAPGHSQGVQHHG
ncbi:MAG: twin-arginine translocation signal domain-containing protein [Ketobacteraceae bacterium]|nr:twin-arginine translocation signal domain-containing protein [Ketobacteraceae bacterium]